VGFLHHSTAPPTEADVAFKAGELTDVQVADTVRFAAVFERVRGAFLALSGLSLFQSLHLAEAADSGGLIATTRATLAEARDHLANCSGSTLNGLPERTLRIVHAIETLEAETSRLAADPRSEVKTGVLEVARGALAAVSAPKVGIVHFSSVSCAGYYSYAAGLGHGHDHPHDRGIHHHHHHE
jgi:hypothetical protein